MEEVLQKETPTFERHDVEETPFSIIKMLPEGKCKITITNNIVSEKEFDNMEEAKKYIKKRPYELIFNVCALITDTLTKNAKNND